MYSIVGTLYRCLKKNWESVKHGLIRLVDLPTNSEYIYIYIYYDLYCRKPDLYDLGMKLFIKFHFARCEHSAFAIYQGDHIMGESFNIVQSS